MQPLERGDSPVYDCLMDQLPATGRHRDYPIDLAALWFAADCPDDQIPSAWCAARIEARGGALPGLEIVVGDDAESSSVRLPFIEAINYAMDLCPVVAEFGRALMLAQWEREFPEEYETFLATRARGWAILPNRGG